MSTTPTTTLPGARTETEIGYLAPHAVDVFWPDEDGEVKVGADYYDVTDGTASRSLHDAAKAHGGQLVSRVVSRGATELVKPPAPPLPTAKGSVVRATVQSRGVPVERLFFSFGSGTEWVADRPYADGWRQVANGRELTVVDVILDASTL